MKLFIVGETSSNPEDWSIWSEASIVIAETSEQACELAEGSPATEIALNEAKVLMSMPEPWFGDDL